MDKERSILDVRLFGELKDRISKEIVNNVLAVINFIDNFFITKVERCVVTIRTHALESRL